MTCIVGYLEKNGTVHMVADGRCTGSSCIYSDCQRKIHRCGSWIVGVSGEALLSNLIEEHAADLGICESAHQLGMKVRNILKEMGWGTKQEECSSLRYGASILIAREGELAQCFSDFGLARVGQERLCGFGSGGDFAVGAASVILAQGKSPTKDALIEGVRHAAIYDGAVGGEGLAVCILPGGVITTSNFSCQRDG